MKKKSIGEKLRELRGTRTAEAVADSIGVSRSSYVKYERDERNPSDSVKKRIADFYGTTVGHIFFE